MNAWDEIIEANKLPNKTDFSIIYDLNENEEMEIRESGKPRLEQTVEILHLIASLDHESAVVLPEGFLYKVDARTVRKNVRPITLRRVYSKRAAIEQEITPRKLIREKIRQMQERYQSKPETLCEDYAGINYRGITDKKTKNYLISDAIEGFLHAKNAASLIEIKRYDTLENLLKTKAMNKLPIHEKASIRRELLKIKQRKMLTQISDKPRKIILSREAVRIVKKVPSTSKREKFYKNIKFRKIPEAFPDNKYPDLNKEFHAVWTDFWIEPACTCEDKTWFISYLRPNQIWYCVHEIAAFRKALSMDWQRGKPITYPNPYIASSPFFKPNEDAIEFYMKLRNQVFTKKENYYGHLAKVYCDIWLEKKVRTRKIELV